MAKLKSAFVVVKRGVYRHDIAALSFTLEDAVERAKQIQAQERDSWHEFEVLKLIEGGLEDAEVVATVKGKFEMVDAPERTHMACGKPYTPKKEVRVEGFEVEYF
ncbi:hypothetical protein D3C76_1326860 [compost metagenome]